MKKIAFAAVSSAFLIVLSAGCSSARSRSSTACAEITHGMTLDQFNKQALADFQKLDHNHDGLLEPEEFARRPAWLGQVKTMPNGQVSVIDYLEAAQKKFYELSKGSRP